MLDSDLAELYNVETKNLKRAVRANIERFPDDFMFELTKEEYDSLRCKNYTLKSEENENALVGNTQLQIEQIRSEIMQLRVDLNDILADQNDINEMRCTPKRPLCVSTFASRLKNANIGTF